jgi:hypothetical protein
VEEQSTKKALINEARYRLENIARSANEQLQKSESQNIQYRLKQAAVGGATGFTIGFLATVATGGDLPTAAGVGTIGFGLQAIQSAAAAGRDPQGTAEPVIFDLVRQINKTRGY